MEQRRRKPNRLKDYDYSQNGAYFITICIDDRKPILSRIARGDRIIQQLKGSVTKQVKNQFGKKVFMTI